MRTPTEAARPLGFWMCTALIVGNMIGMGVFMLPAALAPYGRDALSGWAVTVAGCLFVAHVFARLARAMPGEEPYGYCRRAFGGGVAFFVMWCYWVSLWVTNAALAIGVVGYLGALVPGLANHAWLPAVAAIALLWFFVLVSLRGARISGRVQLTTAALKLLPMGAIVALGVYVLLHDSTAFSSHLPAAPLSFEGTAAAGTIALFAMLGVEAATLPATKVEDPARTIPRATIAGTLLAAAVYIAVCAIPLFLLPQAELARSDAPFADLFARYWDGNTSRWLAVAVAVSGLGALNGWTMLTGEVMASFSRNGAFPAALGVANRHGAPARALLLAGALSSAMVAMNYSRSLAEGFTFLTLVVTAASMPLYLVGGLAVFKLYRRGVLARGALLSCSAALSCLFVLWAFYGMGSEAFWWGMALGAIGMPVFWLMRQRRKGRAAAVAG